MDEVVFLLLYYAMLYIFKKLYDVDENWVYTYPDVHKRFSTK